MDPIIRDASELGLISDEEFGRPCTARQTYGPAGVWITDDLPENNPYRFGTFVSILSPPFEKTYSTNSHVSFQKDIKAYVGINRVYFSEGGERTNVPNYWGRGAHEKGPYLF